MKTADDATEAPRDDDGWSGEWSDAAVAEDHEAAREWLAPAAAIAVLAGWTAFFLWAERNVLAAGVTPRAGIALITAWAPPALLVCLAWLLALRTSRREASRFGNVARLLSAESTRLETRLTVVNRELSLAREFIAAQSRDLEALGRIAAERLGENAERLQSLIRENGAQVDAIAGVSTTALDNMERLRGQLPVITSSTKDVANTIGHVGQTAKAALEDLIGGFERLARSGETSARHVNGLREEVESALTLFDSRLDQVQSVVSARIEALEHRGSELRDRLSADEADALAALERRAAVLHEEFDRTRMQLETHEAEALTSLRARLAALRDEGTALARALREGEAGALEALMTAKSRVEDEIRDVLERLDKLDRNALEAASHRIQKLSEEALEFDNRLVERNRHFAEEMEQRLVEARARHDAETQRLATLFAELDQGLNDRLERQAASQRDLAERADAITAQIDGLSDRIAAIAAYGNQAEASLGSSLATLTDRLAGSRESLAGTSGAVDKLTDGAVRLLELLQASAKQSHENLPGALASSEQALVRWETRLADLAQTVTTAGQQGDALARQVAETRESLAAALSEVDRLQAGIADRTGEHAAALADIRDTLSTIAGESEALSTRAAGELNAAIAHLQDAARGAYSTLSDDTAGAINDIAARLGDESATAIDRAMRLRLAEAVGVLEQAASHAAGVSREATIQLRDQLAKVNELTGNLEQRVARARERAEEQVDNDFSRRVALITESLNSSAIDVAKALSTEVTDTAWAAYLKGDRGIFTRRALRLLDAAEQREIVRLYEDDMEFRGHVSRYIHDFESMLRQLLSTRDGHALGVTLLSSDMGKLYVLLAQSIERLRT